jgi:hypothetical protein
MNWTRNARSALAGLHPRQTDKHIRSIQSNIVLALFSYEVNKGDRAVSAETWQYLEIRRKEGKS